jgi:folylpolyglutamate synthase/dihydrofolate synthase
MVEFDELMNDVYAFVAQTGIYVKGDQKLERVEKFMEFLGSPQEKIKVLHVAGTSGKTSTSYYIASLLKAAGQKVGLTVSPHITDIRERAQIDLSVLEKDEYVLEMREFFELARSSGLRPSYFEFFNGFFFWLAQKSGLDYVAVETGLGGLYDATNVIHRRDKVCLITDIGYDHEAVLGGTLPEIAAQKAGIIHAGNEVFLHAQSDEIMNVVIDAAARAGALVNEVDGEDDLKDALSFQARNASLALAAVEYVLARDNKEPLTHEQIKEAIKVRIPARAEEFEYRGKRVVIDGAHNPQKIEVFARHILSIYQERKVRLVFTLGDNKEDNMAKDMELVRRISDDIVLTTFCDTSVETHFRESMPLKQLKEVAKKVGFRRIETVNDPISALNTVAEGDSEIVVVVGSFYLLNHIRPILVDSSR